MVKTRKKGGTVGTVPLGHQAFDAPDNPLDSSREPSRTVEEDPVEDPPGMKGKWSGNRLRPMAHSPMDAGSGPAPTPTDYEVVDGPRDRDNDHGRTHSREHDTRCGQSELTPLDGIEIRRLSPTRASTNIRGTRSPPSGEEKLETDRESQRSKRLRLLEREARVANERLRRAQEDSEDERMRSPRSSKVLVP
jgi:hypothetical protein